MSLFSEQLHSNAYYNKNKMYTKQAPELLKTLVGCGVPRGLGSANSCWSVQPHHCDKVFYSLQCSVGHGTNKQMLMSPSFSTTLESPDCITVPLGSKQI